MGKITLKLGLSRRRHGQNAGWQSTDSIGGRRAGAGSKSDPFFGTGTTGAVAKRLGREWIGCEREPAYREVATRRIEKELPLDESALATMQTARTAPRVAFGAVVEAGLLPPGTEVFDRKRRWTATVRADGSLACGAQIGSIHGLGKDLQGAPSCNGWAFWHYEAGGEVKPIDAARQLYLLSVED